MAVETAGEVELEKRNLDRSARRARQTNDLIDRNRRRAEQRFDAVDALAVAGLGLAVKNCGRRSGKPGASRLNRLDDIGGGLNQCRPVANELIAASCPGIERRAGDRHHLSPGLGRKAGGDQRARARRRLDNDGSKCKPGNDPVAIGEMAGSRFGSRRHFGKHQPMLGHCRLPGLVFGRIEDVDAAGDHSDGPGFQCSVMGGGIDSPG